MMTRFGFRFVLAAVLTFVGAATSASNLLYLVDGLLWAVVAVAWVFGRMNLRGLRLEAGFPDQIFQGTPFGLALRLDKVKGRASHQVSIVGPVGTAEVSVVRKGAAAEAVLTALFPRRGLNRIAGLRLESPFPFGLFLHRRPVPPALGLAFPRVFEIYGRRTSPAVREGQVAVPRRGVGEDFRGLREYAENEDSRLICWKLTAKTGRPLVKEYAEQVGRRITITLDETDGPEAEARISEAASLSKFFIDAGAEVRLVTPETTVDFGRGLLHLHLLLATLALTGDGRTVREIDGPGARSPFIAFPSRDRLPGAAYAAVAVAFASLALIEEINPLLLLAFSPVLAAGFLFDRARKHPVPKRVLDLMAAAFLPFFVFIDLPTFGALQADLHLVLFILFYLLLSPKTSRVAGQLFVAAFLAFALASGLAVSLLYFPFFLAYFSAAGAWLIRQRDPIPERNGPAWTGALAGLGTAAVLLAALVFLLLPRPYSARMQQLLAGTGLTRLAQAQRSFAGLSERVELGYLGPIRKNTARVMRVSPGNASSENRPPFIRVRGTAFGVFDGRRWHKTRPEFSYRTGDRIVRARQAQAWMRRERRILYAPDYDPDRPVRSDDFTILPLLNTNIVFSLGNIAALETSFPGAYFDSTDTAYFPSAFPEGTRYRVHSQGDEPSFHRSIEGYEALLRDQYARLSVPVERYRRLAEAVAGAGRTTGAEGQARALEAYFRTTYAYSLGEAHGRQSLEAFLFDNRAGNCEYFATAMVILLRHLEIPARLVVGFLSSEWNAYGRFFDVRQSDAHAWVEAFLPDRGWTTFDPTPAESSVARGANIFARVWTSSRRIFDALQDRWYRYVVGFDPDTRDNFFFHLRLGLARHALAVLAILGLAAAGVFLLRRRKPRPLRARPRNGLRSAPEDFFERIVARLGRAGFPRRPAETAAAFATALVRRHPELEPVLPLAAFHYRSRYGGRPLSPHESRDVEGLAARLENGLRVVRRKSPAALASKGRQR